MKSHPILMKFCTQQQILNWMNVMLRLFQMKKLHWTDSEFDRTYFLFVRYLPEKNLTPGSCPPASSPQTNHAVRPREPRTECFCFIFFSVSCLAWAFSWILTKAMITARSNSTQLSAEWPISRESWPSFLFHRVGKVSNKNNFYPLKRHALN